MKDSEVFKLIHHCLTDNRTPEILCISKEQKLEKDHPIHLHDGFEIRMLLSDDETCLVQIEVILPRICHYSLDAADNARSHVLQVRENAVYYKHRATGVQQYFISPYKVQLLHGLNSLAKEPDSILCKEECRLLLSLFYLRAASEERMTGSRERIQLFAQYLHDCYYQHDLSIADTAERFNISPGYIQQVFREKFSINPKEYLLKIRMDNALKLLSEHRYYIFEIASLCGFSDAHYFSEVFRQYYGTSPREYFEKNKKNHISEQDL